MSPTDSVKCSGKLRGFTLIELIIVMAIIVILACILSLVIGGFQRDARIESANNRAGLIYTGFQNVLIRCEINQTLSDVFGVGSGLIYVDFTVDEDAASEIDKISSVKVNNTALAGSVLTAFKKAVVKEFSFSFGGDVHVWINLDDFQVDSVCYTDAPGKMTSALSNLDATVGSHTDSNTFSDIFEQRDVYKSDGSYVTGVYPMASALT